MNGLALDGITVRFGGLIAVNGLSLTAGVGTVTGLIGPNGAGKTTTFNACCGSVLASSGHVRLHDRDLTAASPAARARAGLGRTFQRMQLCSRLTVAENVALGPEGFASGRRPWGQLFGTRAEQRHVGQAAEAAMQRCGILDLAAVPAGDLSTGQRRFVELARALASPFSFLLLDEPSSGLDVTETERFGDIVLSAVDSGLGVLLVEHDMALVRRLCQYVWVMDFGVLITSGPTEDVLASPEVRAAYLGSEVSTGV